MEHSAWEVRPLGTFSPNVVDQCDEARERAEREAESAMWLTCTGGAATVVPMAPPPPPLMPGASCGGCPDSPPWPMEAQTALWRRRAAASERPRSTLGLVEDFLSSRLAADFLPPDPNDG